MTIPTTRKQVNALQKQTVILQKQIERLVEDNETLKREMLTLSAILSAVANEAEVSAQ